MLYDVDEKLRRLDILDPKSPCMAQMQNIQRKNTSKPNVWSSMLTVKLEITITEIPKNGEVHIISSFNPNFWKT